MALISSWVPLRLSRKLESSRLAIQPRNPLRGGYLDLDAVRIAETGRIRLLLSSEYNAGCGDDVCVVRMW